jgi:selenocysteine lyase/cysteine desulfurase
MDYLKRTGGLHGETEATGPGRGSLTPYGADAIYARNLALTGLLRATLEEIGWQPVDVPEQNRSTIVSIPLEDRDPDALLAGLAEQGVVCSLRDGNLRVTVHFYNDEDDLARLAAALRSVR